MEHKGNLQNRQTALIQTNVAWLRQALALIERASHEVFTASVGSHLRHVLEFYECFLDGVESSHIDYDARKRDESVERNRFVAADRIRSIIQRLETAPALRGDSTVFVRMEDAEAGRFQDPFLCSSVSRELQVLSSHTIHHFALIALTLKFHGIDVDQEFGVAPSTLRFRASQVAA
jgi:hypothetical protein